MKRILFMALAGMLLALPVIAQEWEHEIMSHATTDYEVPENIAPMKINTLADMINKRPALPTVADLMSPEAKAAYARKGALAYEAAIEPFRLKLQGEQMALQNTMREAQAKRQQQYAQQRNYTEQASKQGLMLSQEETMQVIMSSGLNLETATEEQMMNVLADAYAKKWNISQADARTFMGMAMSNPKQAEAFLKQKYPALYSKLEANAPKAKDYVMEDPNEDAYGKLQDQLMNLSEEARNLKESSMEMSKHTSNVMRANGLPGDYNFGLAPTNKLEGLFIETIAGWAKSSECKQAIQIENGLNDRLDNWEYWKGAKEGQTICHPAWWIDGRKQENALFDTYTKRTAEQWIAAAHEYDAKLQSVANRMLALDAQLEQLRGGKEETLAYCMAKLQVFTVEMYLVDYYRMASTYLTSPCISHQEEQFCFEYWIKG
ncbi:MAG: hypothetical protein IJS43_01880 [Bacteroidaceae bacterium]|nr:hypothetical protein [Bacteroidaceae bacterium]